MGRCASAHPPGGEFLLDVVAEKLQGDDAEARRRQVSCETPAYSKVPDVSSTTSTRRLAS